MTAAGLPDRVVLYTDADGWGGAEVSLGNLAAALDDAIDVVVAGTSATVVEQIAARRERGRVDALVLPPVGQGAGVRGLRVHRKEIELMAPAVFHANLRAPWACQWELFAASTIAGISTVAVEQLPLPIRMRRSRVLKRFVSRRLDAHVAVGRAGARAVEAMSGAAAGSVRVIANGVPDRADLVAPLRPQGTSVGTLAALIPRKAIDVLLHAIAAVPTATLVVVGSGPEHGALARLAVELGVDGRVTFTGWSERARDHLVDFDLFVLPSRDEGLPLSIVEAMLSGLPVVAADVGSVADVVVDGRTGLLVPTDDAAALAGAISALLGDPERRRSMGVTGRQLALEGFTDIAMAASFESLYRDVCRRPS